GATTSTTAAGATTTEPAPSPTDTDGADQDDPPSGAVDDDVDLAAAIRGESVTLFGTVESDAQRDVLLRSLSVDPAGIDDIVVSGDAPTTGAEDRIRAWAIIVNDAARQLRTGSATLRGNKATIEGNAANDQALTALGRTINLARDAGLTVDTALTTGDEIAGSDVADLKDALAEILSSAPIRFQATGAELDASSLSTLEEVAEAIDAHPGPSIEIAGHTDDRGDVDENRQLSEDRAAAVVEELVANGVEAARLTAVGYGSDDPIADNSTPEGRQRNRRVEFVITGAG
ncbi:MAG: OmpA family protein, partial [Actinomycetota bacterium]|nr:OmpA family protein [Actinomycetota bacterium]